VAAYDCYIRGRQHFFHYSRQSVESALHLFQAAIDIDDTYALAYSGIADCYSYLFMYGESSTETCSAADMNSKNALSLDPLLAEAHASRGVALSLCSDYEASEVAFEKAIELDPKLFEAHYFYARACFTQGKLPEALKHFERAHAARPEDYQAPLLSGQIYDSLKQPDMALAIRRDGVAVAEQHLKYHPHDTRALYMAANGLVVLGQKEKGHEWLELAISLEPDDPMLLYNAGCIYALLDKPTEAMICLEKTVAAGLRQKEWYQYDSNLDSLRDLPRFQELLNSMS
jgi:tetratricopeptide (TPR) repeat protein